MNGFTFNVYMYAYISTASFWFAERHMQVQVIYCLHTSFPIGIKKKTFASCVLLTVFFPFFFQVSWSQMTSLRSSVDTIRSFLLLTVTSYQPSQPGLSMMTVIWVRLFASFVLMSFRSSNYSLVVIYICAVTCKSGAQYNFGLHI